MVPKILRQNISGQYLEKKKSIKNSAGYYFWNKVGNFRGISATAYVEE